MLRQNEGEMVREQLRSTVACINTAIRIIFQMFPLLAVLITIFSHTDVARGKIVRLKMEKKIKRQEVCIIKSPFLACKAKLVYEKDTNMRFFFVSKQTYSNTKQ